MIIEIGDNGLRQRYWWSSHDVPSNDPAEAAHQAICLKCPFLTDDNHTYKAKDYGALPDDYSIHLRHLKELTQDSRYHVEIHYKGQTNHYGTSYWFQMAYRVPGEPY